MYGLKEMKFSSSKGAEPPFHIENVDSRPRHTTEYNSDEYGWKDNLVLTENVVNETKMLDMFETPTRAQHERSIKKTRKSKEDIKKHHQTRTTGLKSLKRKSLLEMVFQKRKKPIRQSSPSLPDRTDNRAKSSFVRGILFGKLYKRKDKKAVRPNQKGS